MEHATALVESCRFRPMNLARRPEIVAELVEWTLQTSSGPTFHGSLFHFRSECVCPCGCHCCYISADRRSCFHEASATHVTMAAMQTPVKRAIKMYNETLNRAEIVATPNELRRARGKWNFYFARRLRKCMDQRC